MKVCFIYTEPPQCRRKSTATSMGQTQEATVRETFEACGGTIATTPAILSVA
jgi:hypothetical protein